MAATIKDIARKLSISTSTVSYALNGGPRPVPDDVKQRVLETAKELKPAELGTFQTTLGPLAGQVVEMRSELSPSWVGPR